MPMWKFNTLARSSCQPLLFALPPLPTLPHTRCCRYTLSHTRCSAARCCTHASSAARYCTHTSCLPIHCDRVLVRHRLQLHQRTLLAAAPMPPLLHTAARTPLAPLLPSPLPPPPLLVPRPLIDKKGKHWLLSCELPVIIWWVGAAFSHCAPQHPP